MPTVWFTVPAIQDPATVLQREVLSDGLRIEWQKKHVSLDPQEVVFTGSVRATYGQTVLTCDQLIVHSEGDASYGLASGSVILIDPDGTIMATKLKFYWKTGFGEAEGVDGEAHGFSLRADKAELTPKKWTLTNVYASPCHEQPPLFALRSPWVEVDGGLGGRADRPSLYFLGHRLVTLPKYSFSLRRRSQGIRLPSLSYDRQRGLELSWAYGVMIGPMSYLAGGFEWSRRDVQGYDVQVSHSLLGRGKSIESQPFLSERLSRGYLENVNVKSPNEDYEWQSRPRLVANVGTFLNRALSDRLTSAHYTVPYELTLDYGGSAGRLGTSLQLKQQQIREERDAYHNRTILTGSAVTPLAGAGGLEWFAGVQAATTLNAGQQYGWLRAQLGASKQIGSVRLSAGISRAAEGGSPTFQIDRLFSLASFHARADLDLGPTYVSCLAKYDLRSRNWYDYELAVRQVAGCLEPYFSYRRFPSSVNIGVRLRIDELLEAFERRTSKFSNPPARARAPGQMSHR